MLLAATAAPPAIAGEDEGAALPPAVRDLLARAAAEAGVPFDAEALRVTRVVVTAEGAAAFPLDAGAWAREVAPLVQALPEPRATPLPAVAAGDHVRHVMIQLGRCEGYEHEPIGEGLSRVGGAWDVGFHEVRGPGAGGVGADLSQADALPGSAVAEDHAVTGVGRVTIRHDFLTLFGTCFATFGHMEGAGAFWFDPAALPSA